MPLLFDLTNCNTGSGASGYNGWTPTPSVVADGARKVVYITYNSGSGVRPKGGFLSETGLVDDIALATDFGDGAQALRYTHQQTEPSKTWSIQHNLGYKYVSSLIIDENDRLVEASVDYESSTNNLLIVTFSIAMKGVAFITN